MSCSSARPCRPRRRHCSRHALRALFAYGIAAHCDKRREMTGGVAMYNCAKCPGYCCSYELIPLTKRDVERLAAHAGIGFREAKKKFTVARDGEKYAMRRK